MSQNLPLRAESITMDLVSEVGIRSKICSPRLSYVGIYLIRVAQQRNALDLVASGLRFPNTRSSKLQLLGLQELTPRRGGVGSSEHPAARILPSYV